MTILIFANGEYETGEWIRPIIDQATYLIAADGGARHLYQLDLAPHIVIGDGDSLTPELKTWLDRESVTFQTYPIDKNETDLELALHYAVQHFDDPIIVLGGMGGRIDQMFANLMLLIHPKLIGPNIIYRTRYQQAQLIYDKTTIWGEKGNIVSLIPLAGHVTVGYTENLKWPLHESVLHLGQTRGISNEMLAEHATIQLHSGFLLCITSSDHDLSGTIF